MQEDNNYLQFNIKNGNPVPLGVSRCAEGINFAVIVPALKSCRLVLYQKGTKQVAAKISFIEENAIGLVRAVCLTEFEYENYEYTYEIDGIELLDSYARKITGKTSNIYRTYEKGEVRCGFTFMTYDWKNDCQPRIALEDIILYRMHVRGFTKHSSSTVRAKGTFKGIEEKIPYLKELGVNQIEVMPIYEFNEYFQEEEKMCKSGISSDEMHYNYWGYSEENYYFAPKGRYAFSIDPETELKDLIRKLHENNMEFIMEFYFPKDTPISLMLDCLRYWVIYYHIDGFHLSGERIPSKEIASEPLFGNTKIYYESMDCSIVEGLEKMSDLKNLAQYSDDYLVSMRRFLKGDVNTIGQAAYFTRRNEKQHGYVNYFTSHNGFTMLDMVSYNCKHNEENMENNLDGWDENYSWNCGLEGKTRRKRIHDLRKRQMKNAWVILMISQGIPAVLAGDEYCNTQNGNNNAYCQDNSIGWVKWQETTYYKGMNDFVKKIINFRKKHPILHSTDCIRVMDYRAIGYPDVSYHGEKAWYVNFQASSTYIGILYCGAYAKSKTGKEDDFIFAALNMNWEKQEFALPNLPNGRMWYCVVDTGSDDTGFIDALLENQRFMVVESRTCIILVGK